MSRDELEVAGADQAEIDGYFDTENFRFHGPDGLESDYAGLTAYFQSVRAAFEDRSIRRRIVVVEGLRWECRTPVRHTARNGPTAGRQLCGLRLRADRGDAFAPLQPGPGELPGRVATRPEVSDDPWRRRPRNSGETDLANRHGVGGCPCRVTYLPVHAVRQAA